MNVTSMLSNGYLSPARRSDEKATSSASMVMQEQEILAQERALKMSSDNEAQVTTLYRYAVGPDGRRYISGAEVTIKKEETPAGESSQGTRRKELEGGGKANDPSKKAEVDDPNSDIIQKLKQTEREVIAHETAHQTAGGKFAGAVSYTYTQGPDGKSYISGGEVPIHVPASSDPEQTVRDMEQVQRAALAPGSPSGQDFSVAAQASASVAQARQQLASNGTNDSDSNDSNSYKAGISNVRAGLGFERMRSAIFSDEATPAVRALETDESKEAYARNASQYGLWALGRGFELEPAGRKSKDSQVDLAA